MKNYLFLLFTLALFATTLQSADPIRVFIRAGEKTHAPGAHEHPQFLKNWTALLESRGVQCDGSLEFPTQEQLNNSDVLILNAKEAAILPRASSAITWNHFSSAVEGWLLFTPGPFRAIPIGTNPSSAAPGALVPLASSKRL